MSPLTLHYHPLSSYCHKALIALAELGVEAELKMLNFGDPAERAAFAALWPTGKMPVLVDGGKAVGETSIVIEQLQVHHAQPGRRLIPADADAALTVRLWDRVCDLHVMTNMQAFTDELLRAPEQRDPLGTTRGRAGLLMAYGMLDAQLEGREWLAGDSFSLADCAAAPSLFYARTYVPVPAEHQRLSAYFERLVARPSYARVLENARPFFQYFPNKAALEKRFYDPAI